MNFLPVLGMLLATGGANAPAPRTETKINAKAVFERFKARTGMWEGYEQDGRKEITRVTLIAGGSVVMQESWFEAHPGEMMVTMFHVDNDKLMLTHYCVAGNQPRLEATAISDDGNELTFTFRDGTNMKSRDTGHMDKVVYRFLDDKHINSRWTWYAKGKESWMENFVMGRKGGCDASCKLCAKPTPKPAAKKDGDGHCCG